MKKQDKEDLIGKFNVFKRIVELTSKHGKWTILYSTIIIFILYNIFINPIKVDKVLEYYNDSQEAIHREGLLKREQADKIVPPIIENLLLRTGADRVMVLEMHNGSKNSSDLPFYHFSATYEEIDEVNDSLDYVSDQYRNQNTGNYAEILREIELNRYIFSSDIDSGDNNKIIRKMKKNGVRSYYLCAIYNDLGRLAGVLTIISNSNGGLDENQLSRITPEITHKISNLISGINRTEQS